jgi:hypothetical protein
MELNKEQIDAITITLQTSVSEVMNYDPNNQHMTDGECLDLLLESVNRVLKFITDTNSIKQTENGN